MVANQRRKIVPEAASCRLRRNLSQSGVNTSAGSFLSRNGQRGHADFLGLRKSLRQVVRRTTMDFLIAGLASVGLFVYLIYALLKPERF